MRARVNRWVDLLERVAWTAVQAFAASLIATGFDDWKLAFGIGGTAAALAGLKVIVAQNLGDSDDGALPSPIEPAPKG